MKFLSLKCDNLYMFKDLYIDFTYKKKLMHPLSEGDALEFAPKIYLRRNMLLLGGNASGKTTFGKLLCAISNYISQKGWGREELQNARYDKERSAMFEVEILAGDFVYLLHTEFDSAGIRYEFLKMAKLQKSYSIKKLREKLAKSKYLAKKERKDEAEVNGDKADYSVLFSESMSVHAQNITRALNFSYLFSNFSNMYRPKIGLMSLAAIKDILPGIDDSVAEVSALRDETKPVLDSYIIYFKNGESCIVSNGTLMQNDRLSHGTYETISFLESVADIKAWDNGLLYIDEQLAHLHAELEAYLVMKSYLLNRTNQLFFTTHNPELLDLALPNNAFLLFKRDKNGFNRANFINETLNKNDRTRRNYYDNDYFGILPDYSNLDSSFEKLFFEDKRQ